MREASGKPISLAPFGKDVVKELHKALPERHHKLIPINEEAIRRGMEIIRKMSV